tara:strand:+ start:1913 stop:2410 length:498 start_codon:yes stop_codon:yes gene_type:complete
MKLAVYKTLLKGGYMQVKKINHVLDWTVEFHNRLAANFEQLGLSSDKRCAMLLDYLSGYEGKLAADVASFKILTSSNALNTWCYEYFAENPELIDFESLSADMAHDEQQVQNYLAKKHQQVIDLYQYLTERAEIEDCKDVLSQILLTEQNALQQMMQSANRLKDV